ncbi:MAG: YdcF family protein [Flammeovirgaceae bacterium]
MNFTKLLKYGKKLFLYFTVWCLLHVFFITYDGFTDEAFEADYAIVLGNKIEMTARPSVRLQTRLDKARELYEKGIVGHIIVSGGLGYEGFEEADIMKIYLEKKGIPGHVITADRNGYTTYLTAKSCSKIIGDPTKRVIVVTHYYHIARTKLAFKRFGTQTVYGVHANLNMEWIEPYAIFREFVAYYYYLLRSYPSIH